MQNINTYMSQRRSTDRALSLSIQDPTKTLSPTKWMQKHTLDTTLPTVPKSVPPHTWDSQSHSSQRSWYHGDMKQRQPRPLTHLGVLMTDTNSPTEDQMPQEISPRTIPVIMRIDDKKHTNQPHLHRAHSASKPARIPISSEPQESPRTPKLSRTLPINQLNVSEKHHICHLCFTPSWNFQGFLHSLPYPI